MATAAAVEALVSGKQAEVEAMPRDRERRNWTARFDDAAGFS